MGWSALGSLVGELTMVSDGFNRVECVMVSFRQHGR